MKHLNTSAPRTQARTRSVLRGATALLTVAAMCGGFGLGSRLMQHEDPGGFRVAGPLPQPNAWYFRSGQWRADARTVVAVAQWCLEPAASKAGATNLILSSGLPNTNGVVSRI